jgi:hypothetical protein
VRYVVNTNQISANKRGCSCKFFCPPFAIALPRNQVPASSEQGQREASELRQRSNGARSDHVVTSWGLRSKIFRSPMHHAEPRGKSARRSHRFKKAGLLPGRLNEIKRCSVPRGKEARCERNPWESATATNVGKPAAVWQKLINQWNGDKRVEEVSRGALVSALDSSQVDEWIPGIEKS